MCPLCRWLLHRQVPDLKSPSLVSAMAPLLSVPTATPSSLSRCPRVKLHHRAPEVKFSSGPTPDRLRSIPKRRLLHQDALRPSSSPVNHVLNDPCSRCHRRRSLPSKATTRLSPPTSSTQDPRSCSTPTRPPLSTGRNLPSSSPRIRPHRS